MPGVGRPAKFTEEQMLDATLSLVASGGPAAATVSGVSELVGAPTGSIYHRFRSRDLLLARLWIRTVGRFQAGFVAAMALEDLDAAAVAAALHTVHWSRSHLAEAQVLLLHRREDLMSCWPDELGDELATVNAGGRRAIADHARRRYGSAGEEQLQRLTFALVDLPYAAVRRYLLAGEPPPPAIDTLVATAARAALRA